MNVKIDDTEYDGYVEEMAGMAKEMWDIESPDFEYFNANRSREYYLGLMAGIRAAESILGESRPVRIREELMLVTFYSAIIAKSKIEK